MNLNKLKTPPDPNVFLGYLMALNDERTISLLSEKERKIGSENMIGCLHDVIVYLKQEGYMDSLKIVLERERIHGMKKLGDPLLGTYTRECANIVYSIYKYLSSPVLQNFNMY